MTLSPLNNIINKTLIIYPYNIAKEEQEKHTVSSPKNALKPLSMLHSILSLTNIIKRHFTNKIPKNIQLERGSSIYKKWGAKNKRGVSPTF